MEKDGKSDDESMTMSDVSSNGPEKSSVTNGTMKMPEEEGGREDEEGSKLPFKILSGDKEGLKPNQNQ